MFQEKQEQQIQAIKKFVQETLREAEPGHDWWHIYRVSNTARSIAAIEKANAFTVEIAALLHDIADYKFCRGDQDVAISKAVDWLLSVNVSKATCNHVVEIIKNLGFKGAENFSQRVSLEFAVVHDADRLDALGAIGIARAFSFGGYSLQEMYNPSAKPTIPLDEAQYRNTKTTTINHFYEKLLHLERLMLTKTGQKIASERTNYMQQFLERFIAQWNNIDFESDVRNRDS
jgi:uncharacterized protein